MEKSSFFNSNNGDRKYDASAMAEYFASVIGNGVFGAPADGLAILPAANGNVAINAGAAWINGYHYQNTARMVLEMATPDGVLPRIDRVVIRWSFSGRYIRAFIKTGTAASTPVAPALQRDSGVYELGIADILVPKGAAEILATNITDLRGLPELCGTVSSIVSEAHTHPAATQIVPGFLSAADKKALDTVAGRVNQDLKTSASPTFKTVTAEKVIGAVYA